MALCKAGEVFGEAAQDFEHRLLVVHEDVAPHGRVGGGDAGEVAEARGREFDDLFLRHALKIGNSADDVVGDQMRHVRRDRQHEVMMVRRHDLDEASAGFPIRLQLRDRFLVRVRERRQDRPAAVEQFGEARLGPGKFGAGDRVARDEVNVLRHMRADIADDGGLDRTGVGEDRALLQVRRDLRCERAECADRRAENDEIRAANRIAGALIDLIRKFKSADGGARGLGRGRWP